MKITNQFKSPIPKTTWEKIFEYLILTVLKYCTYTKYKLKDALVKETCQSKTVTLWRSWGKQAEARIYVKAFHGKNRTNNKPTLTGKQTTITFNNSQRTKETIGLCVCIYIYTLNKIINATLLFLPPFFMSWTQRSTTFSIYTKGLFLSNIVHKSV